MNYYYKHTAMEVWTEFITTFQKLLRACAISHPTEHIDSSALIVEIDARIRLQREINVPAAVLAFIAEHEDLVRANIAAYYKILEFITSLSGGLYRPRYNQLFYKEFKKNKETNLYIRVQRAESQLADEFAWIKNLTFALGQPDAIARDNFVYIRMN